MTFLQSITYCQTCNFDQIFEDTKYSVQIYVMMIPIKAEWLSDRNTISVFFQIVCVSSN